MRPFAIALLSSCAALCLAASSLASGPFRPASADKPKAKLTEAQMKKALEMLTSSSKATRAKAMDGLRLRDEEKDTARELLEKSADFHKAKLNETAKKALPSLQPFQDAVAAWKLKRDEAYKNVMTDWHKDPGKLAMIETQYGETQRLLQAVEKEMKSIEVAWKPLLDATAPLEEIENELANIDSSGARKAKPAQSHLEENLTAEQLSAYQLYKSRQDNRARKEAADTANATSSWASEPMKAFALTLNTRRYYLDIQPLRLDEQLSKASTDHSAEMKAMGYFAHESPVEKNKSPWDRARNAEFQGNAAGECIFMGSAAADAAFGAWWNSDGHRLIMFSEGVNTAGVGPVGDMWTFMSGNKEWK